MADQNQTIEQFVTDVNASLTTVNEALVNIAADEQTLLARIDELLASANELSEENAAKLNAIRESTAAMATAASELAAKLPEVEPLPPPPPRPPFA